MRTFSSLLFFFFSDPATPEIYTLSLHDALPISLGAERLRRLRRLPLQLDVRLRDEVHPAQDVQPRPLGVGWRPARGDDGLEARRRDARGKAGGFQKLSASHACPPRDGRV